MYCIVLPVPTVEEVNKALESIKNGKAAGPDGTPIELLKLGEDSVVKAMHRIIVCVWQTGKWPDDWAQSTFVPFYKKGGPLVCANYRTISLISHASKILLKVILGKITPKTELEVAEEQAGFQATARYAQSPMQPQNPHGKSSVPKAAAVHVFRRLRKSV